MRKIIYIIFLCFLIQTVNVYPDDITDELLERGKALVEAEINRALQSQNKTVDEINNEEMNISELNKKIKEKLLIEEDLLVKIREEEEKIKKLNEKPKEIRYTVIRNDSLWKIAGKNDVYGDPYKWTKIHYYNKDKIKNPDLIYPGQIFRIPLGPVDEGDLITRYEVIKGDSLWRIAGYEKIYGDPYKWPVIYKANKDRIKNPNIIYPYQILDIPRQLSRSE